MDTRASIFLRGSAKAVDLLIREPDLKVSIPESLRVIGESVGADRSYLFHCLYDEAGAGRSSQMYEWNSGDAEPQIDNPELQDVPFELLPEFFEPLLKGEPFFAFITDLTGNTRDILEPQGIKSLIVLPIRVEGALWGFAGFDACTEARAWTEDERSILLSYTASVGAALERSEVERRLRTAKEEAEAANRAKSTFIANVSHEIRTPLNAILGFSELISDQKTDPQTQHYIKAIKTAGESLLSLINTILDLSRMDAFKLTLFPEAIRLEKVLAEFDTIFGLRAKEKGLRFEILPPENLPEAVFLDPARVRQILFNLIGNAIKFTERGSVHLSASARPAGNGRVELTLRVEDTGIGISREAADSIFMAFTQIDSAGSRRQGGTGLGLTITRRLVALMGGRIELDSEPGKGSRFTVTLPEVEVVDLPPQDAEAGSAPCKFRPAEILEIEDIESNRMVVRGFLEDSGLDVLEAEDGERGIELAIACKPSLILLDMQMPVMDGKETLRRLRAEPTTSGIPVVVVTANSLDLTGSSIESMYDGFLKKPFTKAKLISELERFLPLSDLCADKDAAVSPQAFRPAGAPSGDSGDSGDQIDGRFSRGRELAAELMDAWTKAAEFASIDDVARFAERARAAAWRLDDPVAEAWATELGQTCETFDLAGMERIFRRFPGLAGR